MEREEERNVDDDFEWRENKKNARKRKERIRKNVGYLCHVCGVIAAHNWTAYIQLAPPPTAVGGNWEA